ncbi:hypothetical protein [Lysinibacillus pakistanensis]|uniref:Uncharacterized protein n=1 Tax=Lysinibacillus pakistanensis TaxID=759811 RepID=A0ABX6DAQ9_9BACI|nr:hypothetical protein GDS87_13505 [Lysinibacillus pakistanensis]
MKKRYKLLIGILLPLIILFVSTLLITRDSTFDKEVIERLDIKQVNEIEIIRGSDEKTITITDASLIHQIMEQFNGQPLRKIRFNKSEDDEVYWLTLHINDEREIGLRLDNSKNLLVYLYEENYMKDYKFLGDLQLSFIEELFQ